MKRSQLIIIPALTILLLGITLLSGESLPGTFAIGGVPWYGWAAISFLIGAAAVVSILHDMARAGGALENPPLQKREDEKTRVQISEELLKEYDPDGPSYPHPVIVTERCIGCHACVEACPHDVLTIINGTAAVIARDQCVEDTSCQVECPVSPKACIVVNTLKIIPPRKVPRRDPSYMTDVPGCFIIGDVSGTPLIKNAANEGTNVMIHIAHELNSARDEHPQQAEYDVTIIGAGPSGLSAAIMAKKLKLRYLCVEQDTVLSTIVKYPKGKYVYLKPETMEWAGAIHLPGLEAYVEEVLEEMLEEPYRARAAELLEAERAAAGCEEAARKEAMRQNKKYEPAPVSAFELEMERALAAARRRYKNLLEAELTGALDEDGRARLARARSKFEALLDSEDKYLIAQLLSDEADGKLGSDEVGKRDKLSLARHIYSDNLRAEVVAGKLSEERYLRLAEARHKVAGDQREALLNTWFMNMRESGVKINENESCTSVKKASDGDYFTIKTEKELFSEAAKEKIQTEYQTRRVVLAIGTSGTPMKLKVPGEVETIKGQDGIEEETMVQITRDGITEDKVKYKLANPAAYKGRKIVVVGAGNSAVEAAVDLVAYRQGNQIEFRPETETNEVTLVVRSDLKNDLKLGNKIQIYDCIDGGKVNAYFGTAIKEIRDGEVVLMNSRTKEDLSTINNDYVFALIGGDKPTKFLESIGIKIG